MELAFHNCEVILVRVNSGEGGGGGKVKERRGRQGRTGGVNKERGRASETLERKEEKKKLLVEIIRITVWFWELPTYPSPNLTLTLTSHFGKNVALGEG